MYSNLRDHHHTTPVTSFSQMLTSPVEPLQIEKSAHSNTFNDFSPVSDDPFFGFRPEENEEWPSGYCGGQGSDKYMSSAPIVETGYFQDEYYSGSTTSNHTSPMKTQLMHASEIAYYTCDCCSSGHAAMFVVDPGCFEFQDLSNF